MSGRKCRMSADSSLMLVSCIETAERSSTMTLSACAAFALAPRFGGAGAPQPTALADSWGFSSNRLAASGATRILFTNGLNDGWSAGGITEDVGEEDLQLLAVNMENGAHHSDLSHTAPDPAVDTPDVTKARAQIGDIIAGWLAEIMVAQDGK